MVLEGELHVRHEGENHDCCAGDVMFILKALLLNLHQRSCAFLQCRLAW